MPPDATCRCTRHIGATQKEGEQLLQRSCTPPLLRELMYVHPSRRLLGRICGGHEGEGGGCLGRFRLKENGDLLHFLALNFISGLRERQLSHPHLHVTGLRQQARTMIEKKTMRGREEIATRTHTHTHLCTRVPTQKMIKVYHNTCWERLDYMVEKDRQRYAHAHTRTHTPAHKIPTHHRDKKVEDQSIHFTSHTLDSVM